MSTKTKPKGARSSTLQEQEFRLYYGVTAWRPPSDPEREERDYLKRKEIEREQTRRDTERCDHSDR